MVNQEIQPNRWYSLGQLFGDSLREVDSKLKTPAQILDDSKYAARMMLKHNLARNTNYDDLVKRYAGFLTEGQEIFHVPDLSPDDLERRRNPTFRDGKLELIFRKTEINESSKFPFDEDGMNTSYSLGVSVSPVRSEDIRFHGDFTDYTFFAYLKSPNGRVYESIGGGLSSIPDIINFNAWMDTRAHQALRDDLFQPKDRGLFEATTDNLIVPLNSVQLSKLEFMLKPEFYPNLHLS